MPAITQKSTACDRCPEPPASVLHQASSSTTEEWVGDARNSQLRVVNKAATLKSSKTLVRPQPVVDESSVPKGITFF